MNSQVIAMVNYGIALYDNGDYLNALSHFENALEISPNSPLGLQYRAMCLIRLMRTEGDILLALQDLKMVADQISVFIRSQDKPL